MNFKFWNAGGGKSEGMVHVVKNVDTVTIQAGQPCIFIMNGTDDGLAVVASNNAGATAAKIALGTAGPAVRNIEPGTMQNVQVYGFNRHTKILRGTRGASTNDWASNTVSYAIGDILVASSNGAWVQSGVATNGVQAGVVVAATLGSFASQPSSNNGMNAASATQYFDAVKTFIRLM